MIHQNHKGEFLTARTKWRVVLESDNQILVNTVHRHAKYMSSIRSIIKDHKELFQDIPKVSLVFVRRSTNQVAHTLAQAMGSMIDLEVWDGNPPGFIRVVMLNNIDNLSTVNIYI